jgi:hypothetical protein
VTVGFGVMALDRAGIAGGVSFASFWR